MQEKRIAIYHRVMRRENFEKAAKDLLALIYAAEQKNPGKPRILYLDIDGHRNDQGGFDEEMLELQKEFGMEYLMPFLTEAHFPLISVRNTGEQRNDVPNKLQFFHPSKEDYSLNDLMLENFSNTEYQSEETVYAYLREVSAFLKEYQESAAVHMQPPEPYDPHNYLHSWQSHMRELLNELFNLFVTGNLYSAAAMTRTLMECYGYIRVLMQEKSARLLEDWWLCGCIRSWKKSAEEEWPEELYALCREWNRDPEETIRRFQRGNENEWLTSLLPGRRVGFYQVCEYLQEERLYQDYQWACAFVHGQDVRSKLHPFAFYESIYYLLSLMMDYTFRTIRLYSVSEELEEKMQGLEQALTELWGTTSWDGEA